MQPNLDAPPTVEAELAALRRLLDFGEGLFSSSIAVCNSPVERDRLIEKIRETHPGVAVITIPPCTVDVFGFAIEGYTGPPKALFLIGLEASIASQEADSHTLRSLNASRDLWPNRYPCPIVLWLPEYAATALSQQARDYWRFISHRFYFATEAHASGLLADQFSTEYRLANTLSAEEKLTRIDELVQRIDSVGDDPPPALQRHVLDWLDELATLSQITGADALSIRRNHELPVYQRLGDELGKAKTLGKIAGLLIDRGDTDEALSIYREEILPIYDRLGVVREKALTMSSIAGIISQLGNTDEAYRILFEEALPLLQELKDVKYAALIQGQMAVMLQNVGRNDEALKIFERVSNAFEIVGDLRSKAMTRGYIAKLLHKIGQTDEALRIHRVEVFPVYEQLGDELAKAHTLEEIADILMERGEYYEALRLLRDEAGPIYLRLGDIKACATALRKMATILISTGNIDEAILILENVAKLCDDIDAVRENAVANAKIATVLQQRGQTDEALRKYREEILPIFERLGNLRDQFVCRWNIGTALLQKPSPTEADIKEAREHLRWALAMAEQHKYAEAAQIRETVKRLLGD